MNSSLVNSLAKVYDPNPLHGQKTGGRKLSLNGSDKSQASLHDASLRHVENQMDSLSAQMEHLLNMQQSVLARLDGLSQDVRVMGRDLASMREDDHVRRRGSGMEATCRELCGAVERASERLDSQGRRLEGVEKLVEGTQQVISFIGEVVKGSRLVELLFKQPGNGVNKKVRGLTALQRKGFPAKCLIVSSVLSSPEFEFEVMHRPPSGFITVRSPMFIVIIVGGALSAVVTNITLMLRYTQYVFMRLD